MEIKVNYLNPSLSLLETQRNVGMLGLPTNLILSDADGTIIPDNPFLPPDFNTNDIALLRAEILRIEENGYHFGFCSDSSIGALLQLSQRLGIEHAPIIAENADIIYHNGQVVVLRSIPELAELHQDVQNFLLSQRPIHQRELLPTLHYAQKLDFSKEEWAIDPGRIASFAVYAPPTVIEQLGKRYGNIPNTSADISPDFNFFGVHALEGGQTTYKDGKARSLAKLQALGYNTAIIGNSNSDFVPPQTGVKTFFVGGEDLVAKPEYIAEAAYVSSEPHLKGVIDILKHI